MSGEAAENVSYACGMILCKSCQAPVSPQAKACPNCGHPILLDPVISSFLVAFFVGPLLLIWAANTLWPSNLADPRPVTREQKIRQLSDSTGFSVDELNRELWRIERDRLLTH